MLQARTFQIYDQTFNHLQNLTPIAALQSGLQLRPGFAGVPSRQ
jgi:hypothetical protein